MNKTADGHEPKLGQTLFVVYRSKLASAAWWYHARVALCDVLVKSIHDDGTVTGYCIGPQAKVKPGSDRVRISECYAELREAMIAYKAAIAEIDKHKPKPSIDTTA